MVNSEAKAEEDKSIENYIKTIEKSIKNGKITQEVGRQMVLNRINKTMILLWTKWVS